MAIKLMKSNVEGKRILDLLGINTEFCMKAVITIEAGKNVVIEATNYSNSNKGGEVENIVNRYTVIERDCSTCKHEDSPICIDCNKVTFTGWEIKENK